MPAWRVVAPSAQVLRDEPFQHSAVPLSGGVERAGWAIGAENASIEEVKLGMGSYRAFRTSRENIEPKAE
jgi:hypothetical protein